MELKFTCPDCKNDKIEIVYENARATSVIRDINSKYGILSESAMIDDYAEMHFQCEKCGKEIVDKRGELIGCEEDLIEFLTPKGKAK